MEAKHTPGPWQAQGALGVWREGSVVAQCHWISGAIAVESAEANARLIAAAPDLLEVLRAFEAWEYRVILHGNWSDECVKLTPELHEEWIQLAQMRNAAVRKATVAEPQS